jgi:hypothetical protein
MELKKGEEFEWILEDKNHLLLRRLKKEKLKKTCINPVFLYFTIWENSKIDIDLIVRKDFRRANLGSKLWF